MLDLLFIFGAKYLFLASLLGILIFFYRADKETRKKMLILGAISLPLSLLISLVARELYFNPRPFVVGGFEPLVPHDPDNGFPSDHTLLVAALAALLIPFYKKGALWLWLIAGVVGLSRVYVGVHHFVDVLGSIAIALFSAYLVYKTLKSREVL